MPSSSSIRTSCFSIISSFGRGRTSWEFPSSFSRKEGLGVDDFKRSGDFFVCCEL